MSQTIAMLDSKIKIAGDLQTVVRTMKNLAASSIGQYEESNHSLSEYYQTIEMGLGACLREVSNNSSMASATESSSQKNSKKVGLVIFGSDQGLVGQFNDVIVEYAIKSFKRSSENYHVWSVGERVQSHLIENGLDLKGTFSLPSSVKAITPLVGQILIEIDAHEVESDYDEFYLIYNHKTSGTTYKSVAKRLLPLDETWKKDLIKYHWPTKNLPQVVDVGALTLKVLIREYLFVSIFRACTESLLSENSSRLSAMQRADKNIEELLVELKGMFHRLRQENIDEELFDVVSGFEALTKY